MQYVQKPPYIPEKLPIQGQDLFNYLACDYASNHQLHMVLSLDGHLSQSIMAKALRSTLDIEPVLGCRLVEQPASAYWERHTDLNKVTLCQVCETEHLDEELRKYVALSTDSRKDPLVQARIFRTKKRDLLCIKMDHACADGGGLKNYTYLLSRTYNHLSSHRYGPVAPGDSRRDGLQFLKLFGIEDPRQAWDPTQTQPVPVWSFPCKDHRNDHPAFIKRQLDRQLFSALHRLAKKNSATINDLLLTAYYRSFFKLTGMPDNLPGPVMVTVDLRRYMPEGNSITAANLSSAFNTLLSNISGEHFSDTLNRVTQMTSGLKESHGEIPFAIIFELFGMMSFAEARDWFKSARQQAIETNHSTPHLSNIGIIKPVTFGKNSVTEGYIITPAMFAPGFMLGASTYQEVLTLVAAYYTSDIEEDHVQTFLNSMVSDLESCALF